MKDHLKEGDGHGEEHPDVDHLDVRSNRQALGKAQKAKKKTKVDTLAALGDARTTILTSNLDIQP